MDIRNLYKRYEDLPYFKKGFRRVIEDHLGVIANEAFTYHEVTPVDAYRFNGNFYGLLSVIGVPFELYWVTLRLNQMTHPNQYRESVKAIKLPDEDYIYSLLSIHRTIRA